MSFKEQYQLYIELAISGILGFLLAWVIYAPYKYAYNAIMKSLSNDIKNIK